MGTLVATFCENRNRFFPLATKVKLDAGEMRRTLASRLRYCLGGNVFYAVADHPDLRESDRLCWARLRPGEWEMNLGNQFFELELTPEQLARLDLQIGNTYVKRRREREGEFVEVERFVSNTLFDAIAEHPEALATVSNDDFESLCAEIFVRRGFEVDLFRGTKDGGIDFVAVRGDQPDPQIFAVQCKQPDVRPDKPRRALGRPVMQQIYGAAKAWDMDGAIAISGSTYSREAKVFADVKPQEMMLFDSTDVLDWIKKYRWCSDE